MNKMSIFDYVKLSVAVAALAKGIRSALADGKITSEELLKDIVGGALAVAKIIDPSLPIDRILDSIRDHTDMMRSVVRATDNMDELTKVK